VGHDVAAAGDHAPRAVARSQRRQLEPGAAHGNPLINELLVGTGFKDRFSMTSRRTTASSRVSFWILRWHES